MDMIKKIIFFGFTLLSYRFNYLGYVFSIKDILIVFAIFGVMVLFIKKIFF